MKRAVLLAILLAGCAPDTTDHFARAQAIERQILRKSPEAGYDDPRFVHVLRELRQVPKGAPERARADKLQQAISDARRIAAAEHDAVGHLPRRLAGVEAARPARRGPVLPKSVNKDGRKKTAAATFASLDDDAKAKLDITLYSTTWCGYCKRARSWFTRMGIPFTEHDIEKDAAAHAAYTKAGRGYGGVPLIVVNGEPVRGFDRGRIERLIAKVTEG
jgi:glutaredoxin